MEAKTQKDYGLLIDDFRLLFDNCCGNFDFPNHRFEGNEAIYLPDCALFDSQVFNDKFGCWADKLLNIACL